ncbi:MAG TPA: 2,4'-dihydroxyacetophenone dioxygenase family protein [Acidimicrobiales bacterium]|jgi:quercetin dioxygenase-like cupin family protein
MAITDVDTATSLCPTNDMPWGTLWEGIDIKFLRFGEKSGTYTLMTRFAPGVELPKHRHFGDVHAYTIQGRWHYKEYDWVANAGDYIYEPPNSVHTLQVPAANTEPTIVIFTIDKGMVLLDEEDQILMIEDATTVYGYYCQALQAQGDEIPTTILP